MRRRFRPHHRRKLAATCAGAHASGWWRRRARARARLCVAVRFGAQGGGWPEHPIGGTKRLIRAASTERLAWRWRGHVLPNQRERSRKLQVRYACCRAMVCFARAPPPTRARPQCERRGTVLCTHQRTQRVWFGPRSGDARPVHFRCVAAPSIAGWRHPARCLFRRFFCPEER